MEKIRIALSGPAKCKVPSEFMISRSQMMWFARNNVPFVAKMDSGKGDEISYMNTGKQTLDQRIRAGLPTFALGKYIYQILEAAAALLNGRQPLSKLLLSPSCIFVDAKTDDIMLLFYPVNGDAVSYDFALFLKDLVLMSASEDTDQWIRWIESIPAVIDSESAVRSLQDSLPRPAQRPQPPMNQWNQPAQGGWNQPAQNQWNQPAQNQNSQQWGAPAPWSGDRSEAYTVMDDIQNEPPTNMDDDFGGAGSFGDDEGTAFDDMPGCAYDPAFDNSHGGYNPHTQNSPFGGAPAQNSPFGGAPAQNSPFGGAPAQNSPFGGAPAQNSPFGGFAPPPPPPYGGYNAPQQPSGYDSDGATMMDSQPVYGNAPSHQSYSSDEDGATSFDDALAYNNRYGNAPYGAEAASDRNDGTYVYDSPSQRGSDGKAQAVLVRSRTGERYPILKNIVKIGRSAQRADICIADNKSISNIHAVIQKMGNGYYVSDAHSTNGTFIGDRKIDPEGEPVQLFDGAVIRLWDDEFRFMQK